MLASSPGLFILRGSGEKALYRLQRACVITQRIHWIRYTLVIFCYVLRWRELRLCSSVKDGPKWVSRCRCVRSFCACLLSFNTCQEDYCRLWRLCTIEGKDVLMRLQTRFGSNICSQIIPFVSDDTLWKKYRRSRYFSDGFANCWSCPEIVKSKCKGFHHLSQYWNCSSGSRVTGNLFRSPASCSEQLNHSWGVHGGRPLRTH